MRKFSLNVNGRNYEVIAEEQSASETTAVVQAAQPAAPKAAAQAANEGGTPLNAPMPGLIKAVKVKSGAAVKKGDVVLVLEAMKMENDIASPSDGVVSIAVSEGANVNSGDVLFTVA